MTRENLRNAARLEEAVHWHVRLDTTTADEATWTEFTLWLEADAENRLAYDRVEDADATFADPELRREIVAAPNAGLLLNIRRESRTRRWLPIAGTIAGAALAAASLLLIVVPRTIV